MLKNTSIVICLSHELEDDLTLSIDSNNRLKKACEIFFLNHCNMLVTTGWKYREDLNTDLASVMAKYAINNLKIPNEKILKIVEAKDTVGEALFLKKRLYKELPKISTIYIVTSNWHMKRAKTIFSLIFSTKNDPHIDYIEVKGDQNHGKAEEKNKSLNKFLSSIKNCNSDNFNDLYETLIKSHTLYR